MAQWGKMQAKTLATTTTRLACRLAQHIYMGAEQAACGSAERLAMSSHQRNDKDLGCSLQEALCRDLEQLRALRRLRPVIASLARRIEDQVRQQLQANAPGRPRRPPAQPPRRSGR